jgi:hypothetical protein
VIQRLTCGLGDSLPRQVARRLPAEGAAAPTRSRSRRRARRGSQEKLLAEIARRAYRRAMNLFLMPRMSREELQRERDGMRKAAERRFGTKESALATLRELGLLADEAPEKPAKSRKRK